MKNSSAINHCDGKSYGNWVVLNSLSSDTVFENARVFFLIFFNIFNYQSRYLGHIAFPKLFPNSGHKTEPTTVLADTP